MATTKRMKTEVTKNEGSIRKGENTGKFAVFFAIADGIANQKTYIGIAELGDLLPDQEWTYEFAPLLAFEKKTGSLLLDVSDLQPWREPEHGLDMGMNTLGVFESCPDAYIYANGLLSEGNRWRAAS
jgi:hypothetical protein